MNIRQPEVQMSAEDLHEYVRATARMLALPLDAAQVQRVAVHLARTRALVADLQAFAMHPDIEPAEVFCPAPFPSHDPSHDA